MNRRLYAIHRWLSALTLVQLALWTASGLFFAVVPVTTLKGSPVVGAHDAPLTATDAPVPPGRILEALATRGRVDKLTLVGTPSGAFYVARAGAESVRLDARTGEPRPVDEAEARAIASRDLPGSPRPLTATRIEAPAPLEYRGKPLPAWRVRLDDGEGTNVYVDAVTGEVTARRNDVWRVYDFLWSLHIMDYTERDRFRHPLLVAAAGLGLLTVVSGAVLWLVRALRFWRGRRSAARPA